MQLFTGLPGEHSVNTLHRTKLSDRLAYTELLNTVMGEQAEYRTIKP